MADGYLKLVRLTLIFTPAASLGNKALSMMNIPYNYKWSTQLSLPRKRILVVFCSLLCFGGAFLLVVWVVR